MSSDGPNNNSSVHIKLQSVACIVFCCMASGCMCSTIDYSRNSGRHVGRACDLPQLDVSYPANHFGSAQAIKDQFDLSAEHPLSIVTKNAQIELRLVPMPGNANGELRIAKKGLYVAKYETTVRQWNAIRGNGTETTNDDKFDLPVVNVSLLDIEEFLISLNEMEGVPPGTYRLPTRDEWQIACKCGLEMDTYAGDLDSTPEGFSQQADLVAWYSWNVSVDKIPGRLIELQRAAELAKIVDISSAGGLEAPNPLWEGGPRPVGFKHPNAYGLYDMLGNAAELALPDHGKLPSGSLPYVMGGGWRGPAGHITWKLIVVTEVTERSSSIGFRIVRGIVEEE